MTNRLNNWGCFTPESSAALVDWGARLMADMPLYVQLTACRRNRHSEFTSRARSHEPMRSIPNHLSLLLSP